jgi:hypothetical protein
MAKPLDLDAYLGRINYTGPRTPTYDALTGILQAHIVSIPFESFDVLLGRPIRLDPEGLQAKIVAPRKRATAHVRHHHNRRRHLRYRPWLRPLRLPRPYTR